MKGTLIIACGLFVFLLAGCASDKPAEPVVVTQPVDIPVAVHCKFTQTVGPAPAYPASKAALAQLPYPKALAQLKANPASTIALSQELVNLGYIGKLYAKDILIRAQRESILMAAGLACE